MKREKKSIFIKVKHSFFLWLAQTLPITGYLRSKIVKLGGVNIERHCWIGKNVTFDRVAPEFITIKNNAVIASGTVILTHYFAPHRSLLHSRAFMIGEVTIGEGAFIGCNAIVCNSVSIGTGAVVGAGSVVTKNIPDFQVWAGNPAKFISERRVKR